MTCTVINTTYPKINVRNAPNGAAVIGLLFLNQQLVVVGRQNGWYQFFAGDVEHWIAESTVSPTIPNACHVLSGPVTLTPFTRQNTGIYCFNALTPVDALGYCETYIYNNVRLVYQALSSRFGRSPELSDVIAITMQKEWWDFRDAKQGLLKQYGVEGFSRALHEFCGSDINSSLSCNLMETLWFLSGYQPWLLGSAGVGAAVDKLADAYDFVAPQLSNPSSELSLAINSIIHPQDILWRQGKIADRSWQWFNRNTFNTRPTEGIHPCTQVLLRFIPLNFEMYTAAQTDNINQSVC